MLKRKEVRKVAPASRTSSKGKSAKSPLVRRRFVLPSAKRKAQPETPPANGKSHLPAKIEVPKVDDKKAVASAQLTALTNLSAAPADLTETVKTLLHLAQEHG